MRWAERGIGPVKVSLLAIAAARDRHLLHLHQAAPVHPPLHGQGGGAQLEPAGPGLTRADRRRRRRQGHGRRPLPQHRARAGHDADRFGPQAHADATLRVRPRLFLEGNFYVDLTTGTPNAPPLADGGTIPVGHTFDPVQIDQLLDAFPQDNRCRLQQALIGFGEALDAKPSAADDARQDPAVRGLTGAQAINETLDTSAASLRDSAIVSGALTGPTGHELSRTISGLARATAGLARAGTATDRVCVGVRPDDARDRCAAAVAAADVRPARADRTERQLRVRGAGPRIARHRAVRARHRRGHSAAPGDDRRRRSVAGAGKPLLSGSELRGLLNELAPASGELAQLTHAEPQFLPQIDAFDRCITDVFLPTGNIVVKDGPLSSGVPNYQEFWYAMAGQAAEGQGADGNGNFLRSAPPAVRTRSRQARRTSTERSEPNSRRPTCRPCARGRRIPTASRRCSAPRRATRSPSPTSTDRPSIGPADGSRPDAPAPPLPNDPTGKIS